MIVTLRFEIDNAQIEIAADIGLDTKGRVIARSCRNCANRVWVKNNIAALKDSGMAMQLILKNQLSSSNEEPQENPLVGNESGDSEKINQVHDTGIDWVALLKSACASDTEKPTLENLAHWYPPILKNPLIDTDVVSKLTKEDSEAYRNSALKNIVNTIYGRYYNCEELVKRIQNSLKDTEGNIVKAYNESLYEIKNELKYIHDSVNGIEDYIIHNCDTEEEEDDDEEDFGEDGINEYLDRMEEATENEKYEDYVNSLREKLNSLKVSSDDSSEKKEDNMDDEEKARKDRITKGITFGNNATLRYIKGVYYLHNFYENETLMSVDEMNWVVCNEKNIPEEYKEFINQKYIIDIRTFISGFSYWITMADPINTETKLPVHVDITNKLLKKIFEMTYELSIDTLGYFHISMSKHELIDYLHNIIFDNPETSAYFKVLNTSYNDAQKLRNGEEPDSPNIAFCSRYGGPHWKNDFVDLDALARNVENFILQFSIYTAE